LSQVDALKPQPGEDHALHDEARRGANTEALFSVAMVAVAQLSGDDTSAASISQALATARKALEHEQAVDTSLEQFVVRLREVEILVAELSSDLNSYASDIDASPARLEQMETRRAALKQLSRGFVDIDDLLSWVEVNRPRRAELEGGEVLTAPSVLTQTLRLLQFASSYATIEVNPTTGEPKAVLSDPSCKIDALMDDISGGDFGDDSVAVSAVSRQLIELLSARMTKAGITHGLITGKQNADERQKAVDDFQSGKIKWILFTAQAGGVGITLTAARRLIRLQRPWSLVDDKQVNDRVHRIGSEIHDNIIITDYVTEGTVEERVRQVLETKAESFEQVVKDQTQLLALLKDDKAGKL
jgi:SNF2 family DNA or RNA helicase